MMSNTAGILEESCGGNISKLKLREGKVERINFQNLAIILDAPAWSLPQWFLSQDWLWLQTCKMWIIPRTWCWSAAVIIFQSDLLHPRPQISGWDCENFIFPWWSPCPAIIELGQQSQWLRRNKHFEGHEYQIVEQHCLAHRVSQCRHSNAM